MIEKIKCPWCDAEFDVEMPDYLREADCMYEGKVRCKIATTWLRFSPIRK